jgi:hypothetical protein
VNPCVTVPQPETLWLRPSPLAHLAFGEFDTVRRLIQVRAANGIPVFTRFAKDLAERLDIGPAFASHVSALRDAAPFGEHGPLGTTLSMNTLRHELTRRGWNRRVGMHRLGAR